MKAVELREMTLDELHSRERDLVEDLARQRIQLSIKRLDNPLQVRVTRRELARVKTIIRERLDESGTETPAARPAEDGEA